MWVDACSVCVRVFLVGSVTDGRHSGTADDSVGSVDSSAPDSVSNVTREVSGPTLVGLVQRKYLPQILAPVMAAHSPTQTPFSMPLQKFSVFKFILLHLSLLAYTPTTNIWQPI